MICAHCGKPIRRKYDRDDVKVERVRRTDRGETGATKVTMEESLPCHKGDCARRMRAWERGVQVLP